MPELLQELIARLREDGGRSFRTEEATCQGVILPILAALGWDRDNVHEVIPQFQVGQGRVDYCLSVRGKKAAFVEVKGAGENLHNHERQLLEYAFHDGVEIAVLTNGILWWFYLPLLHCNWEQRRFLILDVCQHDVGIVVQHLVTFLGRDAIASGSAVREAQAIHADAERRRIIMETLPRAWDELCGKPDALLLRVLADKVEHLSGYRPGDAVLVEYLKGRARVNRTDARLRFADQCQVSGRRHPPGYRAATEDAHTAGLRETLVLASRGKLNCVESHDYDVGPTPSLSLIEHSALDEREKRTALLLSDRTADARKYQESIRRRARVIRALLERDEISALDMKGLTGLYGKSFSNFISALTKTKVIVKVGRTTLGRGGVYALNPKLRSYVERVIACKDEDIPGVTAKE